MITIERNEWERRYAARVMEASGMEEHQAIEVARIGREEHERDMQEYGPDAYYDTPEGAADEEMSYWENDGDEVEIPDELK